MVQVQRTCACGQKYWPAQRWIHERCGVVNHQETETVSTEVVVNRSKDRHKKTPERLAYIRRKMREYRAKRGH